MTLTKRRREQKGKAKKERIVPTENDQRSVAFPFAFFAPSVVHCDMRSCIIPFFLFLSLFFAIRKRK